jgi:hypothetical protein
MKKFLVLPAVILCLLAISGVTAQDKKAADFSGKWELDLAKSKLDERARIEAMTMTVTQTEKEIKIETATKRAARPESDGGGMRPGGGRGGYGGGDAAMTYSLDGKETTVNQETPMGAIPVKLQAKTDEGKLKLASSRTLNTPMGEMTVTSKETWELVDGGKGLIVKRETQTPRGAQTMEMYFTKK